MMGISDYFKAYIPLEHAHVGGSHWACPPTLACWFPRTLGDTTQTLADRPNARPNASGEMRS